MKIVINTLAAAGIETGGGYTIMSNLLPRIVDLDTSNDYCFIVSEQNYAAFEVDHSNVSYVVLPSWVHRGPLRIFADNVVVPYLAKREDADLYFSPNDYLPPWLRCASVVGAFNLLYYQPAEAILWAASSRLERWHRRTRQLYYRAVTPRSLLRANKVVAISKETRRVVMESIPGLADENVVVVYPGVPGTLFSTAGDGELVGSEKRSSSEEVEVQPPFILSTSAISPYKNFDLLIRSFAICVNRYGLEHKLVIVGRSYYPSYAEELKSLASSLGVSDRVMFRGFVPLAELARLYKATSAFVLLSSCESFGFPALEAMAFGRPVIVSNMTSLKEIVGDAGLTVDPEDLDAVASAIDSVVSDSELSEGLARRAVERASLFSWDEAARTVIDVFGDAYVEAQARTAAGG